MGNVRFSGARGLVRALFASTMFTAVASLAAPPAGTPAPSMDFAIEVLSGRADTVAGGDALVRVTVPRTVAIGQVTVTLNGVDITSQLTSDGGARTITGLVTGLALGDNDLSVTTRGGGNGRALQSLPLVNHPIPGPVVSGAHELPYSCATPSFSLPAGLGNLGATSDPNCHIPTRVDYIYRTTGGGLAQWPVGAAAYPANMAMANTTQGKTVPYVLR